MKDYQRVIAVSRYARWLEDENRRETWEETVKRYCDFVIPTGAKFSAIHPKIYDAIVNLEVMPSMRALMTAGPAMARCNVAAYNCSYLPIDNVRSFDELMYILMCFHPDTLVTTRNGSIKISEISIGDEVLSFDEPKKEFVWKRVTNVIKTPSKNMKKMKITLENGTEVLCTHNHKWLTSNRGWVEASKLSLEDDLVSPKFHIYKIRNKTTNKVYVGYTGKKNAKDRFSEHLKEAFSETPRYNSHLYKAMRKYGIDSWDMTVVDCAYSIEEAREKEKRYIVEFDSKKNGYNSTDGGEGTSGLKWTNEQKEKASKNAYVRTDEHKKRQSLVLKNNHSKINETRKTEKYKEEQRKRNIGENNPMHGYVYSTEQREVKKKQASERLRVNGRFA
jgi:group I intron endonuclease